MRRFFLPLLALTLALSGCGKKGNVLATVDGKDVTQAQFDAYLKNKHVSPADAARRERSFQEYLDRAALASVIEKEKVLDQVDIDAEVEEFRRELLISRYFDRFLDEKVTDGAIKSYYDQNAANYEQRKVHVAHILIRVNQKASAEEKKAKRTTADGVAAKLGAGESFEELAKSASDDRISGAKGGDLGWIREGSIDAELSKRAFAMKAGSVSEVFETPFGFHILKVIEESKTIRKPYAAVVGDIRYQLRNEVKEAELKRLKDKVRINKKKPYKFDPASVPSAKPRSPIVPTLPDQQSSGVAPAAVTGAVRPLSSEDAPPLAVPTPSPALSAPAPAHDSAKKTDRPQAAKAGKPAAPKPVAGGPVAPVAPVAPAPADSPAAPAEAPAEAPAAPAP